MQSPSESRSWKYGLLIIIIQATPYFQRKEILLECANEIRNRREELAKVLCVEAGKPIKDARVEIDVRGERVERRGKTERRKRWRR